MRILVPLAALTLTACAGAIQIGQPGADQTPPDGPLPPNEILITRPSTIGPITTAMTIPDILVDGQKVGDCRVGKPLLLRLDDGSYEVSARTPFGTATQWVTVSNSQINMDCDTRGLARPQPVLEIVP